MCVFKITIVHYKSIYLHHLILIHPMCIYRSTHTWLRKHGGSDEEGCGDGVNAEEPSSEMNFASGKPSNQTLAEMAASVIKFPIGFPL